MNNLPEKIWVSLKEQSGKCEPKGYWAGDKYPCVFKQPRDGAVKYIKADTVKCFDDMG